MGDYRPVALKRFPRLSERQVCSLAKSKPSPFHSVTCQRMQVPDLTRTYTQPIYFPMCSPSPAQLMYVVLFLTIQFALGCWPWPGSNWSAFAVVEHIMIPRGGQSCQTAYKPLSSTTSTLATLFPTPRIVQTAENRYWDKLKYPIVVKEFSAVTSVNFCPVAPFNFAVTSSLKVCVVRSCSCAWRWCGMCCHCLNKC